MFGWTFEELLIYVLLYCIFAFLILATRPNCRWIFNFENESEEKKRKIVRKIAFAGLFITIFFFVLATIVEYFEG